MGCYSGMKNKDTMNFVGKWMEHETIILSEVTQSQKDIHGMYSLLMGISHKIQDTHAMFHRPKEAKQEEGTREDA